MKPQLALLWTAERKYERYNGLVGQRLFQKWRKSNTYTIKIAQNGIILLNNVRF